MARKPVQADARQIGFMFDPPAVASEPAELAGYERQISRAVAEVLKSDPRSREVIAGEMSELLDEEVSAHMLNAYASPARGEHKVVASRFFALIAVTGRHDVLDRILRHIGAAVLVGKEVQTARLGQIDRELKRLQDERRKIAQTAPHIGEGRA
jgi:hypothetical protein